MHKVKLKSRKKLKKLEKQGRIKVINCSDSGEWISYGVVDGAFTHIMHVNVLDHGQDFQVTKLDNSISKSFLKKVKVLFEDK